MKKFDFWHWFGLFAAFALAIYGSYELYRYLEQQQNPQLKVDGAYHAFNVPPFEFELTKTQKTIQLDRINTLMQGGEEEETNEQGLVGILEYASTVTPKLYNNELNKFSTYWEFEIQNTSDKLVSDIQLHLPFSGKFLITKKGEMAEYETFNQFVPVGMVPPNATFYVHAWTYEPLGDYSKYLNEKTLVSYKGGKDKIDYPVKAKGICAWNIKKHNRPVIFLVAAFIMFIAAIILIFYNYGLHTAHKNLSREIEFGQRNNKS